MKDKYLILIISTLMFITLTETIFSLELTESEREWLELVGPLTFSEVDWEPLSYTSDYPEYKGIIADYLKIIEDRTGLEMRFAMSRTWQEVLDKFDKKEIDIIPAISLEEIVNTEIRVTDPYTSFPLVIATEADADFISSTSELSGKLIGVGKGYTSHSFLKQNYPEIELVTTDSAKEGLQLVEDGKIDAFVGHLAVVRENINKHRLNLRIAGKTEYVFEHRIGLPPEHAPTIEIINKVFADISPEEHNQIYNKWIKIQTDRVDYTLVWQVLFVAALIITGSLIWNRRLTDQKRQTQLLLEDLERMKVQLEEKNKELHTLARKDKLTGIFNRYRLDEALDNEMFYSLRFGHPFGIILMDIDFFKKVNDTYGHPVGDEVLVCMAQLLQSRIRKTDLLGRWGGEEFLIICPGTDRKGLCNLAEELRKEIESCDFPKAGNCTASFGLSAFKKKDEVARLLNRADQALYVAKRSGRNRVELVE